MYGAVPVVSASSGASVYCASVKVLKGCMQVSRYGALKPAGGHLGSNRNDEEKEEPAAFCWFKRAGSRGLITFVTRAGKKKKAQRRARQKSKMAKVAVTVLQGFPSVVRST